MLLSAESRDLRHIYNAIASTGHNVSTKLKLEIQAKCFESKTHRKFFDEFALAISKRNVISSKDQNKFKELVANNNTDWGTMVELKAQLHYHEKYSNKLDNDLIDAENEKLKLRLQLNAMSDLKAQSENKSDLLNQSLDRIKSDLNAAKKKHNDSLQQYGKLILEVKKMCSAINRHYSKNTRCPSKISDLTLDKCFEVEREFLSVLTKYAKTQFSYRSSFIDQSITELSVDQNMNETSNENTQYIFQKQELEIDIKISKSGYAQRKKGLIVTAAELAESGARLDFLERNVNNIVLGSRFNKNELIDVSKQVTHLKDYILDQLLNYGKELENVLFILVELRQQLAEKRNFTNKQEMIMSQLNQHCVRFGAISMLQKLESTKTEHISNLIEGIIKFLENEQNNLVSRISVLSPCGKQEKEGPRAVIDSRDTLILSFHDLLGISENSMFATFLSVYQAIEKLNSQNHEDENNRISNSIRQLDEYLKACSKPFKSENTISGTPSYILQAIQSLQLSTDEISSIVHSCVTKMEKEIIIAGKN